MCPKGDDPFTISKDYRTIQIVTSASSSGATLDGLFKFSFGDSYIYFPADAQNWDSLDCERYLEEMPNVKDVECTRSSISSVHGATYTIRFLEFPMFPVDNNVYNHEGNPPLTSYKCESYKVTKGTSPSCVVSDVAVTTLPGVLI